MAEVKEDKRPLRDWSQLERIAALEPVASKAGADWRILYGQLELADLTVKEAIAKIEAKFQPTK